MLTIADILHVVYSWAPKELAWERDNIGLLVGDPNDPVTGILVCLDCTAEVVAEARQRGASCIIAHHPLMFRGMKNLRWSEGEGRVVADLVRAGISLIAAHTNADSSESGLSVVLARKLGLTLRGVLEPTPGGMRLFQDQVGKEYSRVAPRWAGLPREVAVPVDTPAPFGLGVIGTWEEPKALPEVIDRIKEETGAEKVRMSNPPVMDRIQHIAVCTGAGSSLIGAAWGAGADLYLTADLGYHDFHGWSDRLVLVDAGHFETECLFVDACREAVERELAEVDAAPPVWASRSLQNPVRIL